MSLKETITEIIDKRDKRYKREFNGMRMLGSSMPYLPKMYYLWFFSINQVNLSYPHLLEYLPLMSHDDKPILPIYLLNVFAKSQ